MMSRRKFIRKWLREMTSVDWSNSSIPLLLKAAWVNNHDILLAWAWQLVTGSDRAVELTGSI